LHPLSPLGFRTRVSPIPYQTVLFLDVFAQNLFLVVLCYLFALPFRRTMVWWVPLSSHFDDALVFALPFAHLVLRSSDLCGLYFFSLFSCTLSLSCVSLVIFHPCPSAALSPFGPPREERRRKTRSVLVSQPPFPARGLGVSWFFFFFRVTLRDVAGSSWRFLE